MTIRLFHGGNQDLERGSLRYLHLLSDFDFARQMPLVLASVAKHRLAFEQFATYMTDRSGRERSKLATLTMAIDAFDRSNHPGEKRNGRFSEPVRRMDTEAGRFLGEMIDGDDAPVEYDWAYYLNQLRNMVLHGDPAAEHLIADPRPLWAANEALTLLFETHALISFGFSKESARELVERKNPFWARRKTLEENFPQLVEFIDTNRPKGPKA